MHVRAHTGFDCNHAAALLYTGICCLELQYRGIGYLAHQFRRDFDSESGFEKPHLDVFSVAGFFNLDIN